MNTKDKYVGVWVCGYVGVWVAEDRTYPQTHILTNNPREIELGYGRPSALGRRKEELKMH